MNEDEKRHEAIELAEETHSMTEEELEELSRLDVTANEKLRALVDRMYEAEKRAPAEESKHLIKWRNELEAVIDDE